MIFQLGAVVIAVEPVPFPGSTTQLIDLVYRVRASREYTLAIHAKFFAQLLSAGGIMHGASPIAAALMQR
jgi:hypothetical protein